METFFNPKIEESIKELAFQLFKEEILYKHKYEIETIFDKIKTQVENLKNKKEEPISFRNAELIELINNNKNSSTNSISSSQSSIKVSSNSNFLSEGLKSCFNSTTDSNSLNIIKYHQNVYNPNPINNPIIIKFSSNPMILNLCYSKQIDVKWHTKESNNVTINNQSSTPTSESCYCIYTMQMALNDTNKEGSLQIYPTTINNQRIGEPISIKVIK